MAGLAVTLVPIAIPLIRDLITNIIAIRWRNGTVTVIPLLEETDAIFKDGLAKGLEFLMSKGVAPPVESPTPAP